MRPELEVADIFRSAGPAYRTAHAGHLNLVQLKVMTAIEHCRTPALGGHVEGCTDCGHWRIAYNSCRNRHCPKCQGAAATKPTFNDPDSFAESGPSFTELEESGERPVWDEAGVHDLCVSSWTGCSQCNSIDRRREQQEEGPTDTGSLAHIVLGSREGEAEEEYRQGQCNPVRCSEIGPRGEVEPRRDLTVVQRMLVDPCRSIWQVARMTSNNPFGPGSPLYDLFKRQREMEALFKYARGPGYELQQQLKALEGSLAPYRSLEKTGVFAQVEALRNSGMLGTMFASNMLNSASIAALQARSSPIWMLALQSTARGIAQKDHGILNTQQLLAASAGADVLKLVKTFNANRSIIETMTAASKWTEQFRLLGERLAPGLAGLKLAAERARMVDMSILRASAEATARSSVVIVAEQVLEAHGLIEAIGHADSHAQSITLFAQLLGLVEAIFSGFQENTVRELKGVGAFRLIELLLMAFAIWHMIVPAEMAPAEQAAFAEVTDKIETVEEKLGKIVAADEAADESYIADLPRAELKRDVAIRREPRPRAPVLMHGLKGTQLAVKDSREKWRFVVYRDLLTDQLAEGWVYAPAVEVLDDPAP